MFFKTLPYAVLVVGASSLALQRQESSHFETRASWKALGCFTDNVSGRALPNGQSVPGGSSAMTNGACQTACKTAGYNIAGTEYGGECWCGNSFGNGGGPAPDGEVGCNMPCNGNANEKCGGSNHLTAFQYSDDGAPAKSGKRGLCYNNNNPSSNAVYANLFKDYKKVSWAYDWGFPSWNLDASFEFCPMLWGLPSGDAADWTKAVQNAGTKNILGFNEPDLTYDASSNIIPETAAAGYKKYIQPFANKVRIGMPNVLWNNIGSTSGGNYNTAQWTQYFLGNCTGCHFDFAAIHWYQDCEPANGQSGAAWFQGNVTDAYNNLKLPVWITEFECYGSEQQQIGFLEKVLPWLDQQSYVERYAYFGTFPQYLVNAQGTGLSDLGRTYATV